MAKRTKSEDQRNQQMFVTYIMIAIIFILTAILISTRSRSSTSYPGYMMDRYVYPTNNPDMFNYMYKIGPDGSGIRSN
ncbi:hypothetical protein GW791_02855 [Candidatus Saccharibacteria bacterium]|nr:hypothetical protein [Candidatus Saccharibacteria bacterium]